MTDQKKSKALNIALWVAQGLLGVMFLMAGAMKASQPVEAMVESLPWVTSIPVGMVRFIGISEFLGGLGLLLPSILRIKPFLTVWAAMGLSIVMVLAAAFHASRGEFSAIGVNLVLVAIFVFVAWGRKTKVPIEAK